MDSINRIPCCNCVCVSRELTVYEAWGRRSGERTTKTTRYIEFVCARFTSVRNVSGAKIISAIPVTYRGQRYGINQSIRAKTTGRQGRRSLADALDPLHRQLTANVRDRGSTRLSVLITLQTFPVRSGVQSVVKYIDDKQK